MKRGAFYSIATAAVVVLVASFFAFGERATNCGGNSYALYACKDYTLLARLAELDGKSEFKFSELTESDRVSAVKLAQSGWIGGADFFVRTNFTIPQAPRLLIIVCEHPFGNVPQPSLWNFHRKNYAHAVGYSDGSTDLISAANFAALDLNGFVRLSSLDTNGLTQLSRP